DRVRRVSGPSAHAEHEQPAASRPDAREGSGEVLDGVGIERRRNADGLIQVLSRKGVGHFSARPHSIPQRRFNVRITSTAFLSRKALLSPRSRSIRSIGTSRKVLVSRKLLTRTSG